MLKRKPYATIAMTVVTMALLICACNKEGKITFEDQFTLKRTGRISFALDSMTKKEHAVINFSQDYNSLCLFNEINHSIYFFDVSNQETTKVIQFEKEGPNGVSRVAAMLIHAKDSIFLFNDSSNEIMLMNEKAKVVKRFRFFDRGLGDPARVLEPDIYFNGKDLYLLGRVSSFTSKSKDKNIVKYVIEKDSTEFLMDYPASYQEGKWSSKLMNKFAIHNPVSDEFVISFPFDPYIHIYNEKLNTTNKYYAGSDLMRQPEQITEKEKSTVPDYLLGNSWYWRVFHDPYKNIYLRSASLGYDMQKTDLKKRKYGSNNRDGIFNVTIILNKDFQKVGEVINLNFYKATFSTKNGIYIQDFETDSENEDIMTFGKYQFVEK